MSAAKLKVKTSSKPNSRIAVEVEVPADRCQNSYNEALSKLSRSISIPGFRKGKVPKAVVIQQLGVKRIQASALESLLQTIWTETLDQEGIEPLCEPELEEGFETMLENFNPEKILTLKLETDISPIPTLKKYSGLTAEVETLIFDPKKVDELIEQSRAQLATKVPVSDRAAKKGDIALVSFKGRFSDDGSEIEGGKANSIEIELEEGRMIPGFIEGVIGMNINDEKVLKCEFPKDYHQEDAKGRKAEFNVTLEDLKIKELPEVNDEFAKQASDKDNLADLRSDLEKRLKEDNDKKQAQNRQDSLLNALVEELEVELPKSLIDQEVRIIVEQTAQTFAQQGIDVKSMFTPELVKSLMESSKGEAEKKLRQKLALNALAKSEKIEVSENEINSKLKEVEADIKFSKEQNIDANRIREAVADDLLQEKLFIWLEDNNTVLEKAPDKSKYQTKEKSSKKKTTKTNKEKKSSKTPKS
ncbi:trigger factor [Prochlorococcus marinus]|uniref:Trigger factor n=1 Tax=Prochlorococcus marinus XMU1408 TaxID=2213228 RepID=A0A318R1Q5_PROMR|nr:trigger factor [Prochlorococcus marinus]MBW3042904.1 trigger factor [Prochlorococcus marinus str. XMU1408]PYE00260.1 trigger factor [Prochlorococcus marinus XMU1408]